MKICLSFILIYWLHALRPFPGSEALCPDRGIPLCLCQNPGTAKAGDPLVMVESVQCYDSKLTSQAQVNQMFRLLRDANGLSSFDTLTVRHIKLRFNPDFTLDLSPFLHSMIHTLEILDSPGITLFALQPARSERGPSHDGLIDVVKLHLKNNKLTFERLGSALSHFSRNMSTMDLSSNLLKPSTATFLPGLSALSQLTLLNFETNQFFSVPDNFFRFQPTQASLKNVALEVRLSSNGLNSQDFSPVSGLERIRRPLILNLDGNSFTSLSALVFEPILNANPRNLIKLALNLALTCDSRMAWLQRPGEGQTGQFRTRVVDAECTNDRGNTVFNSMKIAQPFLYGAGVNCPSDSSILAPCTCRNLLDGANSILCRGYSMTQVTLSRVLNIMRNASDLSPENLLPIQEFKFEWVPAQAVNLSLFTRNRVLNFFWHINSTGGDVTLANAKDLDPAQEGRFDVKMAFIVYSRLTDEGLGRVLSFFSPKMTHLALHDHLFQGPADRPARGSREFLPGLSALINLEQLVLDNNNIEELAGGPFRRNVRLLDIRFKNNLKLKRIGSGAFLFDPTPVHLLNTRLLIHLENCAVTENFFAEDSGLERLERPLTLIMTGNKLRSLPEKIFRPILKANSGNWVYLSGNPIECDDRLAWLQNERTVFAKQVFGTECSNDPGKSIFQSELVQKGAPTICPVSGIHPCTCKSSLEIPGDVECSYPALTQDHIDSGLTLIREANSDLVRPGSRLWFSKFHIRSPLLSLLTLRPFAGFMIDWLAIQNNVKLVQVFGPERPQLPLAVSHLTITGSKLLSDTGLSHCLRFFSNDHLTTIDMSGNGLTARGDFLPGLASMSNLLVLNLADNKIQTIPPSLFRQNTKLSLLNLTGNQIMDISRNAFLFNGPPPSDVQNRTFNIILESNLLTSTSFAENSGLDRIEREVHLNLRNNKFTTFPQVPFQAFLKAFPGNSVDLKGNPLVCDEQVEWLIRQKEVYADMVQNADCVNHPGLTIFNFQSPKILGIVLGAAIPSLLIFVLIVVAFGYKYKGMKMKLRNLTLAEVLEFRQGNPRIDPNDSHSNIYGQPFEEKWEISPEVIQIDNSKVLGSGQFGIVYSAFLLARSGVYGEKRLVAVKTVKPAVDVETFKALLMEIKVMCHLGEHPNVISLIGASTQNIQKRQALAVVEYCANGDLLTFLIKHGKGCINLFEPNCVDKLSALALKEQSCHLDDKEDYAVTFSSLSNTRVLSTVDLLKFATGIANGMRHLTKKNVIHADLACRNILLTANLQVKVSDFGLSRQLKNYTNYIKKSRTPLPFRWMSIEALTSRNFSIKSDVWSFGVTLWEILSLGEIPYPEANWDFNFVSKLKNGDRLQRPKLSEDRMYELMLDCWRTEPSDRPDFDHIHGILVDLLTNCSRQLTNDSYTAVE